MFHLTKKNFILVLVLLFTFIIALSLMLHNRPYEYQTTYLNEFDDVCSEAKALRRNCLVWEDHQLRSGNELWQGFQDSVSAGNADKITIASRYEPGADGYIIKNLTFDGSTFTLETGQKNRSVKHTFRSLSKIAAPDGTKVYFVLTDSLSDFTFRELYRNLFRSPRERETEFRLLFYLDEKPGNAVVNTIYPPGQI
ncbi:hypothetical protein [Anaerolentibacter hominis]|uniref:hypothetical protein n=1 Tax=Anaerolentibacter hominis TaxID=3079009 RepID=UPI0031B80916